MAEWRVARGWSEDELVERLRAARELPRNFDGGPEAPSGGPGWEEHGSHARVARESPGPPEPAGAFERGREALERYAFSDPSIVEAHFERDAPLEGRRMLLELKVLALRYLCGVVVGEVLDERDPAGSVFGFRYDTLQGHIEAGREWFVLEKDHGSGDVLFRIDATWRPGDFPNAWSRLGFAVLGRRYQRRWHARAHDRMAAITRGHDPARLPARPRGRRLAHEGPEVVFSGSMER